MTIVILPGVFVPPALEFSAALAGWVDGTFVGVITARVLKWDMFATFDIGGLVEDGGIWETDGDRAAFLITVHLLPSTVTMGPCDIATLS